MNTRDNRFRLPESESGVAQADMVAACVTLREHFGCTEDQAYDALQAIDFHPKFEFVTIGLNGDGSRPVKR